jgi:hypothetical protein
MIHDPIMNSITVTNKNDFTIIDVILKINSKLQEIAFERTAKAVAHFIIYDSEISESEKSSKIPKLVKTLIGRLRSEDQAHFDNYERTIRKSFSARKSSALSKIDWFQLNFENIYESAAECLSWRALINTFNCILIIKNASDSDLTESEKNELKSRMKDVTVKFIKRRFRRFIKSNGDWEGLKKYESATRNQNQRLVDPYLVTHALAIFTGALAAIAIFRRI